MRTSSSVDPGLSRPTIYRITHIRPSQGWVSLGLPEVWAYRELLFFLVWRDISVRYKQTALGVAWAVIQPLATMLVFTLFFGRLAKMPSDGVPYALFAFAALVPWTLFSTGLTQSSNSLVGSTNLITKVYFPRLIIPIASTLTGVVDFILGFATLIALMMAYGVFPTTRILWIPVFVLVLTATSMGVGFWLSALNVQYRDVRHAVPFLTQLWLFASPIAYSSQLLSEPWRTIYALNPLVGVIEGFRWALLRTDTAPDVMALVSACAALAVLVSGAYYFRRAERRFADVI